MGCDIHIMIEWAYVENPTNWYSVSYAEMRIGRNYELFARLAKVRGAYPDSFNPRGLPETISWQTKRETHLYIMNDDRYTDEFYVTTETAAIYVKSGDSTYTPDKTMITHPDWHSHSWLKLSELKQVQSKLERKEVELDAIIAMMEVYEANERITRIVFWFDN